MGEERIGVALVQDGGYGVGTNTSGHAEQSRGLVDDNNPVVLVYGLYPQLLLPSLFLLGVGVNVESLQHPGQYGLTLSPTGRVEVAVLANLCPW